MEDMQNLVQAALQSIGAIQTMAIAGVAGLMMKDSGQILYITLGALGVDQIVRFVRAAASKGSHVDKLTSSSWADFLNMPMGQFLATLLTFALVIGITFSLKSMLKKV